MNRSGSREERLVVPEGVVPVERDDLDAHARSVVGTPVAAPAPVPYGTTMTLDIDTIRRAPKVMLHDHLDGGLRPQTIIELAAEGLRRVPTTNPDELSRGSSRCGQP